MILFDEMNMTADVCTNIKNNRTTGFTATDGYNTIHLASELKKLLSDSKKQEETNEEGPAVAAAPMTPLAPMVVPAAPTTPLVSTPAAALPTTPLAPAPAASATVPTAVEDDFEHSRKIAKKVNLLACTS